MNKKQNKKEKSQLVLKFPGANDATTARLRKLLMHYTGKLVTKTECDEKADEDDEDTLDLNAEPETETTAELTLNLKNAEAEYILEKILAELEFDRNVSEFNKAAKKIEKGA